MDYLETMYKHSAKINAHYGYICLPMLQSGIVKWRYATGAFKYIKSIII